jgi:2'-5' RNA ligase
MPMYAILSELDPESSTTVNKIWRKLCEACGLTAIYKLPLPHLTWMVAEDLDRHKTTPILARIADNTTPLTLHTFGLGIFTGENPVLYLPTVKSVEMIDLHERIWDQVSPFSTEQKLYYSPRLWVPHITLAINDLNQDNLACAINAIAFDTIELFIQIDNLAIAQYKDKQAGEILAQFEFSRLRPEN